VEIARTAARESAQAADHDFNIAALGLNRHIALVMKGTDQDAAPVARS
jgi:hypothetical protein